MSNNKAKGPDYSKVKPEFVQKVKGLIAEIDRTHNHSASAIFSAHNEAFGLNDKVQMCRSCVLRRTNELREWITGYNKYQKKNGLPIVENTDIVEGNTLIEGVKLVTSLDGREKECIHTAEGTEIHLLPEDEIDEVKGLRNIWIAIYSQTGKKVKAGTYKLKDSRVLAVQIGGKASIKELPAEQ